MSIKALNPYLNFNGNGLEAIALYERALGAQVEGGVMKWGDLPGMDSAPADKNRVMHAMLRIGEGVVMISDTRPQDPASAGNNVHVCLQFTDVADMTKKFEALAVGGKVTMPLADTFWGARFGMLVDAFGVGWMFNCELKKG